MVSLKEFFEKTDFEKISIQQKSMQNFPEGSYQKKKRVDYTHSGQRVNENRVIATCSSKDLNMPKTIPKRAKNHMDYLKDAPLTSLGQMQAFLTGKHN